MVHDDPGNEQQKHSLTISNLHKLRRIKVSDLTRIKCTV